MSEPKSIPAVKARVHLGEIMKRAFKKGEHFIVEKAGLPMVAIINAREYLQLVQEREERFKVLDRIQASLPEVPQEEIDKDVRDAIQTIRRQRA